MLEITVKIDDIDYDSVINSLIPLVIGGKIKQRAARFTANATLSGLTNDEKNTKTTVFINNHNNKICKVINNRLAELGAKASVTQITANNTSRESK